MSLLFDLSRLPNTKEAAAFAARLDRLRGAFGETVELAAHRTLEAFPAGKTLSNYGFRVRPAFSYRSSPAPGDYSDRKVPPRHLRPPATRISSSQGATLRFYLMTLAVAQMTMAPGGRPKDIPIVATSGIPGWTDFVATDAVPQGAGGSYLLAKEKRARSIRSSLNTLKSAGLVEFTGPDGRRGRYDKFVLLNEAGNRPNDAGKPMNDVELYKVPEAKTAAIRLPEEFIRNSWLHVLEDSELALLLMIACGRGALPDEQGYVAIPSDVRLLHYGIGRDPFSRAHKTLEWFGLIDVHEIGRHHDGKAEGDDGLFLHRFALRPQGFLQEGLPTVISTLQQQLGRI